MKLELVYRWNFCTSLYLDLTHLIFFGGTTNSISGQRKTVLSALVDFVRLVRLSAVCTLRKTEGLRSAGLYFDHRYNKIKPLITLAIGFLLARAYVLGFVAPVSDRLVPRSAELAYLHVYSPLSALLLF